MSANPVKKERLNAHLIVPLRNLLPSPLITHLTPGNKAQPTAIHTGTKPTPSCKSFMVVVDYKNDILDIPDVISFRVVGSIFDDDGSGVD